MKGRLVIISKGAGKRQEQPPENNFESYCPASIYWFKVSNTGSKSATERLEKGGKYV